MSIVVSNSSPICYLRLINQTHLLPSMFGQVIIPEAVVRELSAEGSPEPLREWMAKPPEWLRIQKVTAVSGSGLERVEISNESRNGSKNQIDNVALCV